MKNIRSYVLVTFAYWGFTITDGALRMLIVLHFYRLGYSDITLAFLFLFYEFFGMVANLLGGWIASRSGLKTTLYGGLALQIFALLMLGMLQPAWDRMLSVSYVMTAQALSGIAKDLTKMSAKSAIKVVVPDDNGNTLFKWVSRLTGSKNALKGAGFFVGGILLSTLGFVGALVAMAAGLLILLLGTVVALPPEIGRSKKKVKFTSLFSKSRAINWLSAARIFLFGGRDVWFVVGLPIFLSQLGWTFSGVGAFIALWFVGYGIIQAFVPDILRLIGREKVDGPAAQHWAFILLLAPLALIGALRAGLNPSVSLMVGLAVFAVLFAINSAIHSFLVLAYTDKDSVALNVGFYYMSNAGGRLLGTLLSGLIFQQAGFSGCLWGSATMVSLAALISLGLPRGNPIQVSSAIEVAE